MLKPHIWLGGASCGTWVGDIDPGSDAQWDRWFQSYGSFIVHYSYGSFIVHYATLAQRAEVDLLCIGAELQRTVALRPQRGRSPVEVVR